MMIQEKINALMAQEAFAEAFRMATTAQEVVDLFHKHGIEVPLHIAQELFTPTNEAELSEDDLDMVAGGGAVGKAIGSLVGGGVFYGAGYIGGRLAGWSKQKSKSYAKKCSKAGNVLGGLIGDLAIPF
ncbi:MAG: hypothetical protein J6V25_11810 [Oscillospiraceae bacterium]|nr:hypothetical protein [Oscillospiraceae bacterium]